MAKKISIIFTSLCISILILAHVIVPHHHHEGMPCFAIENISGHNSSSDSHQDCSNHQSCCGHHHGNEANNEETCILDQLDLSVVSIQKSTNACAVCLHLHDNLLQAILLTYSFNLSLSDDRKRLDIKQPPYLINYHSVLVNQNIGLRAPPAA